MGIEDLFKRIIRGDDGETPENRPADPKIATILEEIQRLQESIDTVESGTLKSMKIELYELGKQTNLSEAERRRLEQLATEISEWEQMIATNRSIIQNKRDQIDRLQNSSDS